MAFGAVKVAYMGIDSREAGLRRVKSCRYTCMRITSQRADPEQTRLIDEWSVCTDLHRIYIIYHLLVIIVISTSEA